MNKRKQWINPKKMTTLGLIKIGFLIGLCALAIIFVIRIALSFG